MAKKKEKDVEVEDTIEEETFVENPIKNKMNDKTRYIIIGISTLILLVLIIVLAIFSDKDSSKSNAKSNTTSNVTSDSNSTVTSNRQRDTSTDALKSFYEAFDSKELKVIFFARTSCGYCSLEKPILKQISEDYDLDYYNIDTDELTASETQEIMTALGITGSTPTTSIVKDGKVVANNVGYLDGKPYVEFFVKNGVLKEGSTYKPEEELVTIDYSEFKNIAKKKENSIILIDDSACSSCISVRSMLNNLASKNNFKVNYLPAKALSTTEINSLIETDLKEMEFKDSTYKDEGQVSIPLLLIVKDNKIVDYVIESTEESDYTKVLEKYKFIK